MARRISLHGFCLLAWVCCLSALLAPPADLRSADQPANGGPLDILFLVDNSHSLNRYDPFALRGDLIKAVQQFYGDGRDRYAIAEFTQKAVDFQSMKAEDWEKLVTQKLAHTDTLTSDPTQALGGVLTAV